MDVVTLKDQCQNYPQQQHQREPKKKGDWEIKSVKDGEWLFRALRVVRG